MATKSSVSNRARKSKSLKPAKPYADFPLSPHPSGKWQKKINGKIYYFGRWAKMVKGALTRLEGDGWKEALEAYKAQADDLHAGRTPRVKCDELTVAGLCNRFLTAKLHKRECGEITQRTFGEYKRTTDRLVSDFGKTRLVDDLAAEDFESLRAGIAKVCGPVRLGNEIQRVRTVFKYGVDAGLIEKAVRFGGEFKRPSKSVLRKHRANAGKKLFSAAELRALIDKAGTPLRAMILLGINCAFGNSDCGIVGLADVNLETGWVNFPRPKTGIERRCPLWPETVDALRAALAERPKPKSVEHSERVFITKYGGPWADGGNSDAVTLEMGKILKALKIERPGLGFYALRHTFRTIADATRDFPAVRIIMGHADDSIDDAYRESVDDERLDAVVSHVHKWLLQTAS